MAMPMLREVYTWNIPDPKFTTAGIQCLLEAANEILDHYLAFKLSLTEPYMQVISDMVGYIKAYNEPLKQPITLLLQMYTLRLIAFNKKLYLEYCMSMTHAFLSNTDFKTLEAFSNIPVNSTETHVQTKQNIVKIQEYLEYLKSLTNLEG